MNEATRVCVCVRSRGYCVAQERNVTYHSNMYLLKVVRGMKHYNWHTLTFSSTYSSKQVASPSPIAIHSSLPSYCMSLLILVIGCQISMYLKVRSGYISGNLTSLASGFQFDLSSFMCVTVIFPNSILFVLWVMCLDCVCNHTLCNVSCCNQCF